MRTPTTLLLLAGLAFVQLTTIPTAKAQLTTVPDGGNRKALVGEKVGLTDITIHYNRPGVKGREGAIWGKLIPPGFNDLGFGTSKAAPWRAGANENTTIEFSTPVKIEGQDLPAGKYGFFVAYDPNQCTLIFSKNNDSWGSFFYDPKEDALRVKVTPQPLNNSVEWLTYSFLDQKDSSAVIALQWEKQQIPFTVSVPLVDQQLQTFRNELRTNKGFTWNAWDQAARFTIAHNTDLDEGLAWADNAINANFIGQKNFQTLSTKAQILTLKGRQTEADALMKDALPLGSMNELHQYARTLLAQHRAKEAFETFQLNYERHPGEFTTNMGMARGWSALGDYKKALTYLAKAQPQAPDPANKANIEKFTKMLRENKDIN